MVMYFLIQAVVVSILTAILDGSTIDRNPKTGLFGFMH